VLREDRRAIFRAAAAAQKAADWILSLHPDYAQHIGEAGAGCEAEAAPEAARRATSMAEAA